MSVPESNYKAWMEKAENDFLNIENNLRSHRIPWDTVCFHSQQAAEKLLKAFLVYHGRPLVRTHDLVALLARCVEVDPALTSMEEECRRLTSYAVVSRYPAELYEPREEEARMIVAAARRLQERVLACLSLS